MGVGNDMGLPGLEHPAGHSHPFGEERLAQRGERNVPRHGDDLRMAFLLKQWRWRLSPAGRRARKANAERVALLTSTKRTA